MCLLSVKETVLQKKNDCNSNLLLDRIFYREQYVFMKLSFTFTDDDIKLIRRVQKKLTAEFGKTSAVSAIRFVLRYYFDTGGAK